MPRGGRRPGAGRKSAIETALREAVALGWSPQQVACLHVDLLVALHRAAMRGNVAAARQYLRARS